jgi:AAA+ superfamily predicted ATPase
LSHYENIVIFCDENEDNIEQQSNFVTLSNLLLPAHLSYKKYALNNVESASLSLSWRALSLAISNNNKDKVFPLTINEANKLANLYPVLPGQIQAIYKELEGLNLDEVNVPLYQYCQNQCLKINSQSLGALAELFEPRYTLDSMVLTEKTIKKLSELINRIHYADQLKKSLPDFMPGLKALFWGKPGTGKSMAAEAIAGELKLPLYKINLANIASKWIGETEKHLADVFDKAQKQNAVLLFDEADAVFSKRSEIESSHDKNANMGVSYLLQRMESYTGLLLLSTNFKGNLDSAFLRRFHSLVEFPMPDVNTREQLWRNAWAGDIKLDAQLDVNVLAQLHDFSPSQITNIAERSVLSALMKQAYVVDKLSLSAAIASELEKQDENYLASKKLNAWLAQ